MTIYEQLNFSYAPEGCAHNKLRTTVLENISVVAENEILKQSLAIEKFWQLECYVF